MRLSGFQHQKIQQALLAAFDEARLRQMARFELDTDLDQIAGGKDLTERAYNLVLWADRQDRILDLVDGAARQIPANGDLQALAAEARTWLLPVHGDAVVAPYKGLAFYDVADTAMFCGRHRLTAELVEFLRHQRFLAVIGASGSGKSSVVRAGLVVCLGQGATKGGLPGSERWLVRIVTPGTRPLESLALALLLAGEGEDDIAKFVCALRKEPQALHLRARRLIEREQRPRLLLVIDQFEELFTQCEDPVERKATIANLVAAAGAGHDAGDAGCVTSVVIALRADLYHRCAEYEELRRRLESNQRYIGAMSRAELWEAIVKPAEQAGLAFEPGLVDQILDDAEAEPGALPLFSFALLKTWEARNGTTLTFAGYRAAGGVQRALAKAADEFYAGLDDAQKATVKRIMLQLVQVDDNGQQARRRVPLAELIGGEGTGSAETDGAGGAGGAASVEQVLARLQSERLITTMAAAAPGGVGQDNGNNVNYRVIYVDVTHEALIREWGTLRQWLSENRAALLFRDRVDDAMREWADEQEDSGALLRGRFLSSALEWQQNNPEFVTPHQAHFLTLSEAQRQRERSTTTRRTILLTALASAVVFLLIPGLYFAAQTAMYYLRQGSAWQATDFSFDSVLSLAIAPASRDPSAPIICVGTSDIGVGCTSDLRAWNVYEAGLPQKSPERSNTRRTLLGSLWGSTWATKVMGIGALAFDQADPWRMYATVLDNDIVYASQDGGVHWNAIKGSPESDESTLPKAAGHVVQLAAHGNNLFLLTTDVSEQPETFGVLYRSPDAGRTWAVIGGPATPTGTVRDFVLLARPSGELWGVAVAGSAGLFWLPSDGGGAWRDVAVQDTGVEGGAIEGFHIAGVGDHVYAAVYDEGQKRGALYRWAPAEDAQPSRVWEYGRLPVDLTVEAGQSVDERVWLLFSDGSVASVSRGGQAEEHGSRPGWPFSSAKAIRVLPGTARRLLPAVDAPFVFMAHSDGLLQLCDEERGAACWLD